MTDPLNMSPDGVQAVAQDLADVSSRIKQAVSTIRAIVDSQGAVWGDDALGHSFAEGPDGYRAQRDWVNDSLDAKVGLLDTYAEDLHKTSVTLQQQDLQE